MKLIVGLGNPGKQYENTRHNAGFLAVDFFLKSHEAITCASRFNSQVCEYQEVQNGKMEKVLIIKPQSFMNLSGEVVREIASFYKIDIAKDLLVVHDEVDIQFGKIKVTDDSSAAGHNGVQNIFDELNTKNIHRVRIGVESRGSRNDLPTDVFVLQPFTSEEMEKLNAEIFPETDKLIEKFIKN